MLRVGGKTGRALSSGVVMAKHYPYVPRIKRPDSVSEVAHLKYGTLFDILTRRAAFTRVPTGTVSLPAYADRQRLPCKLDYIETNFGAEWAEGLKAWVEAVAPTDSDVAAAKGEIDRQVRRVQLTRYTWRELALGLADGADREDLHEHMHSISIAECVRAFASLGEERYKLRAASEAKFLGWTDEQLATHLAEVKGAAGSASAAH